jgi:hypothetical protein
MVGCFTIAGTFAAGPTDDRKALADPDPQVRLKAALPLARQLDEQAVGVLIELLAELRPADRRLAEQVLQELAEEWAPNPGLTGDDEVSRRIRRDCWAVWWKNTDGAALLAAFRKRTLTPDQTARAKALTVQLGDKVYAVRARAFAELVALGPAVLPLLRQAMDGVDLEQLRRLEQCIQKIEARAKDDTLPPVAARLLAVRKPAGATEALLAYLPCTEDEVMKWEVGKALQRLAAPNAKPDPVLVKALADTVPLRRAVAGEVLAGLEAAEIRAAVRKLLADADRTVRLRVAVALACAGDKEAIPVLIDLLAELPREQRWRVEEILYGLADDTAPTFEAGDEPAARQKYRAAWQTWWKDHAATTRPAARELPPPLLGFTVIAETPSRVLELDARGKLRWAIDNLQYPTDVHILGGNRVLICETNGKRITERDFKGNILWEKSDLPVQPYNVQRLANGNTFVALSTGLREFDPAGKTVFDLNVNDLRAAWKMPDGKMVYLTGDAQCVRLDAAGKEIGRFLPGPFDRGPCLMDLGLTSRGSLLISKGKRVEEFDQGGKVLWRAAVLGCGTATRNGHIVVSHTDSRSVTQYDRAGAVVWRYQLAEGHSPWVARQR